MNKDVPKLMSTGVPITLDKAIKEVRRKDLNAPLEDWIKAIDWSLQDYDREKARRKIENTKFDISLSADKLKAIYRQLKKGNRVC